MICFGTAAENKFDRSVHHAITFANVSFKTEKSIPVGNIFPGKAANVSPYCLVMDKGTRLVRSKVHGAAQGGPVMTAVCSAGLLGTWVLVSECCDPLWSSGGSC